MQKLFIYSLLMQFSIAYGQFIPISEDMCLQLQSNHSTCVHCYSSTVTFELDTTCTSILTIDSLYLFGIGNGTYRKDDLKYLKNLNFLYLNNISFEANTILPNNLRELTSYGSGSPSFIYPENLEKLIAHNGFIFGLLPDNLRELEISDFYDLSTFINIPKHLKKFVLSYGNGSSSIALQPSFTESSELETIIFYNLFETFDKTVLHKLNKTLDELEITACNLDTLEVLPAQLHRLTLNESNLRQIDYFPPELQYLDIDGFFNCLPEYPQTLQSLYVNTNMGIDFCHPNFVPGVGIGNDLCSVPGNNFANCPATTNALSGYVFHDSNGNCNWDLGTDMALFGIPLIVEDGTSTFIKTYTDENGFYSVNIPDGSYTVRVDTSETTYRKTCSGFEYSYNLIFDVNNNYQAQQFQLSCDTVTYNYADSFDLQLNNVWGGNFRPGSDFALLCVSGKDILYNQQLNCSSGFENSLDSIVHFDMKVYGAPMGLSIHNDPEILQSESNDTLYFSYIDSNFRIDNHSSFCVYVSVDTTAQIGDWVCVDAVLTPPSGDLIVANNTISQCFEVVNSYDPNMKQTWPMKMLPGFDDEIRYTIHFQNTGTAAAINVQLVDTLDSQLDLTSFRVIEASHNVQPFLSNNRLLFKFNNINLADSISDPEGSKGHVTYAIKPKAPMQLNDEIHNTAHIFFDFNSAIVTNTSVNLCTTVIAETSELQNEKDLIVVYPNPIRGENTIRLRNLSDAKTSVKLVQINGAVLGEFNLNAEQNVIDVSKLQAGIYLLNFELNGVAVSKKVVKL